MMSEASGPARSTCESGRPLSHGELARFHAGEHTIFQACVSSETPALLRHALALTRDREQARELVQETWARAFERRLYFDNRGPLLPWLCTICRNVHVTQRRRDAHERHHAALHVTLPAHAESDGADQSDTIHRVRQALQALTQRQRSVIVHRLLQGQSTRATALRMGVAEGTVKATLHQAISKLRPLLEDR